MAVGNIFEIPVKTTINASLNSKSILIVGKSKTGKSTLCSQAPRPIFLMTENGGEGLTGFTPVPIASWSDFKNAVNQLCSPKGRENFDTVVID
ncbi:MAG: AAA family ATPase, partial [Clostridiales bacterium]|nr:AAA family ATPase [Clostridiales bacterium]